jgi:hypothetical protein
MILAQLGNRNVHIYHCLRRTMLYCINRCGAAKRASAVCVSKAELLP